MQSHKRRKEWTSMCKNLLFLRHPDDQSHVWAIYEERIVKPGGGRKSFPGRCGGDSPRRRSRSVRPLRPLRTGCEPVDDSLSPRGREGTRTLSPSISRVQGRQDRKTLNHLFEIVRPGLSLLMKDRGGDVPGNVCDGTPHSPWRDMTAVGVVSSWPRSRSFRGCLVHPSGLTIRCACMCVFNSCEAPMG